METRTTAGENTIKFCVIFLVTLWKVSCGPEVTLAWKVSVKNPLQNNQRFTPSQSLFLLDVNTPLPLIDKLPVLEPTRSTDIIRSNTNALHSERNNFIQKEHIGKSCI